MNRVIVVSDDAPVFRGGALHLWNSKAHEIILAGPFECVAGNTLILDPLTGIESPIADLARIGKPITVLTKNGARMASAPFKKGVADLYQVETNDGGTFTATANHRVLTTSGWCCVSDVLGRTLLRILPVTNSEPGRQESLQGVRCSLKTIQDCRGDYSAGRRQCDGQLRQQSNSGQVFSPSQGDVLLHSYAGRCLGDCGPLSECSHPDQRFDHHANDHLSSQCVAGFHKGYRVGEEKRGPSDVLSQVFHPFDEDSALRPPIALGGEYHSQRWALHQSFHDLYSIQAYHDYTVHGSNVSSVECVGVGDFYDMHVPGEEHYYAQGFFHHNTGKTFAALYKLHALLCIYPKANALMVRQTRNSILGSAVVTYEQKVLPFPPGDKRCPVEKYGGERPEFYRYWNGSRLTVGGLDDANKYLSAEYDYIYVNQAEEISLDSWEKLVGRATGRAGNVPTPLVWGDCNPGPPKHWIKTRESLTVFESRHEDNPSLYDGKNWTERGRLTISILDGLTGLRYKRGRLGLWVGAEGTVYEFDSTVHLLPRFDIPASWRRIRSIDFGYTNPFVCQWWAIDEDGRMYLYREIYMSGRTVRVHSEQINKLSQGESYDITVADHDAEDRATLDENEIYTMPADKRIKVGIEKVEERLKLRGDGRPRLFVLEGALIEIDPTLEETKKPHCTHDEFSIYAYPEGKDGRPVKEEPMKLYDHGMDALRYAVMYLDNDATGMDFA